MKASFAFGPGLLFWLCFGAHSATAQAPYKAGYRCVTLTDSGRIYKPNSQPGDHLHFRPLEIDLWYPAVAADDPDTTIRFGEFIGLLEQRADRFQDDTVYAGLTANLVRYLCANLGIADTSRLVQLHTNSHKNAPAAGDTRFPVLIYLCSYNGICFENVPLFETLASHGFLVASITSIGRYPGNMSTKPADLFQQVDDGLFAIRALEHGDYHVDSGKIGLIGYSWGGPAALVMAMNDPHIGAVLSLDGSEIHYYGDSKEEDKDFDQLRSSSRFRPVALRAPYGYLESVGKQNDRQVDSIFDILPVLQTPRLYLRFPAAQHEDFSCLPRLAAQLAMSKTTPVPYDSLSLYFFDRWLKGDTTTRPDSRWLNTVRAKTDSVYPVVTQQNKATLTLSGRIFDNKDRSPLAYVNAGIPGQNTGTVSAPDGSFTLRVDRDQAGDTIVFSMAGYQAKSLPIAQLRSRPQSNLSIYLDEKVAELGTIVLTAKKIRVKRIGNTSKSTFMSVGFPLRAHGTEMGIRIDLGKTPVRLKTFNFHLADSHVDSAILRLNIHVFKDGLPGDNLLQQNILVHIGRRKGPYSIDLTNYNILLKGDILVSLEWLGDPTNSTTTGALFFSAGFFNSATWRRQTSQGNWIRASGIGIGFNLDVQGK